MDKPFFKIYVFSDCQFVHYRQVASSSHPAFRLVGRSHCSSFIHVGRHACVLPLFGIRASRIPRLSGQSLVGLSRPQPQPIHATGAIPKRPRLPSPGSGSSLGSDSSSGSASRDGFPPCKTVRHFTQPSVSASATATTLSTVATTAALL